MGRRLGTRQAQLEVKGAAHTQGAVHTQRAAHQFDQVLADRQPQAGAAEAARGRCLGLREAAEDVGLVLGCDAYAAVLHRHFEQHVVDAQFHGAQPQLNLAGAGELDGVAAQVDEHLLQPQVVAQQGRRQPGVDVQAHGNGLAARAGLQDHRHVVHQSFDAERPGVQRHLAGFDL